MDFGSKCDKLSVYDQKSEMAGPFNRGDTIIKQMHYFYIHATILGFRGLG